jgi:hypothetical protein
MKKAMKKAKYMRLEAINVSCECGNACVDQASGSKMICRDDRIIVCIACGTQYSIDPSIFEMNLRVPRQRKQQMESPAVRDYPPREVTDSERLSWSL